MDKLQFVYVTYIATTPEKLWNALTIPDITARYWQHVNVSDWQPGARWEHRDSGIEGAPLLVGRVLENSQPKRLILTWAFPHDAEHEEKQTQVTFEIEPIRGVARLTVTYDRLEPDSEMLRGITDGWPKVLSSLKSFLEVGQPLPKLW